MSVLVKLDYDALASYAGGLPGAPATSPSATGRPLTRAAATSSPYARQVADREADIVAKNQSLESRRNRVANLYQALLHAASDEYFHRVPYRDELGAGTPTIGK